MLTQIINGRIFTPQGWLNEGSVLMRDGKILEVTNCDLALIGANLVDARGMYIAVSYTHLDVYKRQTLYSVCLLMLLAACQQDGPTPESVGSRTVLVYMIAQNSLAPLASADRCV